MPMSPVMQDSVMALQALFSFAGAAVPARLVEASARLAKVSVQAAAMLCLVIMGYCGFLEFFEGPGDVAEILWVLGIDVMVNEEGD